MTKTMKLLTEALDLPEADRIMLTRELTRSLEEDYDADAAVLWEKEIRRRSDSIHQGKARFKDAFAAAKRIKASLRSKKSR
jgi:hypothetical protein